MILPVYVPVVTPVPSGDLGDVSGTEAVVIGACILLPSIWLGISIYDLYRGYRDLCRGDGEAKKKDKERRKRKNDR